jgi:hypothetical protein
MMLLTRLKPKPRAMLSPAGRLLILAGVVRLFVYGFFSMIFCALSGAHLLWVSAVWPAP